MKEKVRPLSKYAKFDSVEGQEDQATSHPVFVVAQSDLNSNVRASPVEVIIPGLLLPV